MQHFGLRQFSRAIFTIAGIVLLIIFGARAASQAGSLAAAGGQAKRATIPLLAMSYGPAALQADSPALGYTRFAIVSLPPIPHPVASVQSPEASHDSSSSLAAVLKMDVHDTVATAQHEIHTTTAGPSETHAQTPDRKDRHAALGRDADMLVADSKDVK